MSNLSDIPKTIFCDIDGTLVLHDGSFHPSLTSRMTPISGTVDKLREWCYKGYTIILTTGRKECLRLQTIGQLRDAGIPYDQLIMNVGRGVRVLINDRKPSGEDTAIAINLDRDSGIEKINV